MTLDERQRLLNAFEDARDGNERAYRDLHDTLARPLLAYCLAFTRDLDSAKDLFQQVMIAMYEHRRKFKGGNIVAWVFTIARNACRNHETRARRHVEMEMDSMIDESGERLLEDDEVTLIQQAILELPEEFRKVILLRYFGEMSVNEIADAENISVPLVKVRLFRARKQLELSLRPILGYLS
jgi:RNA polymerase sigma-70 factor (ECF subfamily)